MQTTPLTLVLSEFSDYTFYFIIDYTCCDGDFLIDVYFPELTINVSHHPFIVLSISLPFSFSPDSRLVRVK